MIWTPELKLVAELRYRTIDKHLRRDVLVEDFEVGRADGEDVADEIGIPLRYAEDYGTSPVVAADYDFGDAEVFEAEVVEIGGCALELVTLLIWGHVLERLNLRYRYSPCNQVRYISTPGRLTLGFGTSSPERCQGSHV